MIHTVASLPGRSAPPSPQFDWEIIVSFGKASRGALTSVPFRVVRDDHTYAAGPNQHCTTCSNFPWSNGLSKQARAPAARAWAATWLLVWPVIITTGSRGQCCRMCCKTATPVIPGIM